MADAIQIRAGNKENMPVLSDREPAYVRDENALYIGTPSGNKKVGSELEAAVSEQAESLSALWLVADERSKAVEALAGASEQHTEQIGSLTEAITALETTKLTATKAAAQSEVGADADVATVATAFNALLAALKACGIMEGGDISG